MFRYCVLLLLFINTEARIHPQVTRTLTQHHTANVFVKMKKTSWKKAKSTAAPIPPRAQDRGMKIEAMRQQKLEIAKSSQASVLNAITLATLNSPNSVRTTSFWITNEIHIEGATSELIEELNELPSVVEIYEDRVLQLDPSEINAQTQSSTSELTWGLKKIGVPEVWKYNVTGKGIVVGSIDTGVYVDHITLNESYVGAENYGWYDTHNPNNTIPYDKDGHGTHTVGTMVGTHGIGVAPGAKWMACNACWPTCTLFSLKRCGEFMTCPHDNTGRNHNCKLAPHIINNSWGGSSGGNFFDEIIDAWHEIGIIPIFAAGNSGHHGCSTVYYPAEHEKVLAVGASTIHNMLSSTSSRGPVRDKEGLIKPNLSAPGTNILSASIEGPYKFITDNGTSMAAPHIAGVVALLLEANPNATYDQISEILTATASSKHLLNRPDYCGGIIPNQFPNYLFGHGVVDAFEARKRVKRALLSRKASSFEEFLSSVWTDPNQC